MTAREPTMALKKQRDPAYIREIFSTVLLSLATVASTWSAYQAARWSGLQATYFSQAASARTESEGMSAQAVQQRAFDALMFIHYATALSEDNQRLAQFLYPRFRPEMKVALDAWLATKPLKNPGAAPTPFAMKEYALQDVREAQRLAAAADRSFHAARAANETADRYVLLTVLFTSVLFFAGVAGKTWSPAVTRVLLGLGLAVFVLAAAALFYFPVL